MSKIKRAIEEVDQENMIFDEPPVFEFIDQPESAFDVEMRLWELDKYTEAELQQALDQKVKERQRVEFGNVQ